MKAAAREAKLKKKIEAKKLLENDNKDNPDEKLSESSSSSEE